jgi:hypothetical protein
MKDELRKINNDFHNFIAQYTGNNKIASLPDCLRDSYAVSNYSLLFQECLDALNNDCLNYEMLQALSDYSQYAKTEIYNYYG